MWRIVPHECKDARTHALAPISPSTRAEAGAESPNLCACACACACVHMRVCVCVRMRACACLRVRVHIYTCSARLQRGEGAYMGETTQDIAVLLYHEREVQELPSTRSGFPNPDSRPRFVPANVRNACDPFDVCGVCDAHDARDRCDACNRVPWFLWISRIARIL